MAKNKTPKIDKPHKATSTSRHLRRGPPKGTDAVPKSAQERSEDSFTLLETLIAVSLLAVCLLGAVNVMGKAVNFNDYDRKVSQAVWLAKSVMAKIEWGSRFYDLKELKVSVKDEIFDPALCPKEESANCDFKYTAEIKEWKFDVIGLLTGGLGGGSNGDDDEGGGKPEGEDPISAMIKEQIKTIFGDDILKVASVDVTWPEGAKQNSVSLALLLANQLPLDQFIENLTLPKSEEDAAAQDPNVKFGPDGKPLSNPQNNPNNQQNNPNNQQNDQNKTNGDEGPNDEY